MKQERFRQWRDKKGRDRKKDRGKKVGRSTETKEKGEGGGHTKETDFTIFLM
jgi:hypothetical protein